MIGHRWLRLAVAFGLQTIHRNGTKGEIMSAEDNAETRPSADGCDDPALHDTNVQQSLDNADGVKDHQRGTYPFFEMRVLAAEVRRLREANWRLEENMACRNELSARVNHLREERDLFRTASEAAELRIVELREALADVDRANDRRALKLARVEAQYRRWRPTLSSTSPSFVVDMDAALRDEPQPPTDIKA